MNAVRMLSIVKLITVCLQIATFVVLPDVTSAGTPQEDLERSVRKGDLKEVKAAIERGASINAKHKEKILLFGKPKYIKQGFSGQLGDGWTPLFWAAYEGHLDIAQYLISQGATVDVQDSAGATPIMFAVWQNQIDLVELLLKHGAASIEKKYRMTLLILAAASSRADTDCLNTILIHGIPIDDQNIDGWTALHHATRNPRKTAFLIEKGADSNKVTTDGLTPLILAAKYSQPEVIKILLKREPNVNAQDKYGMSALGHAISNGDQEVVEMLLGSGADLTLKTSEGKSAMHLAKEALESEHRNAIKVKTIDEDSVLVAEGFPFQKGVKYSNPPKLSIFEADHGILKAKGTANVRLGALVALAGSGETLIAFNGKPSHSSLGAKWVFEKPNISFKNGGYSYASKYKGATIEFRDDGVLLRGFAWHHEKLERYKKILKLLKIKAK